MREIKFRGWNPKNKCWLHGFYLQKRWSSEGSAESHSDTAESRQSSTNVNRRAHFVCPDEFAHGKSWDDYEILPETLGQYLCHHDDQDIYEGDIVENEWGERFSVEWDDSTSAFYLYGPKTDSQTPMDELCVQVIGNIHDNLDLLK